MVEVCGAEWTYFWLFSEKEKVEEVGGGLIYLRDCFFGYMKVTFLAKGTLYLYRLELGSNDRLLFCTISFGWAGLMFSLKYVIGYF